ncbi:MAG TPA: hypothetical protein VGB83_05135 [Actinomycetota bacterium]
MTRALHRRLAGDESGVTMVIAVLLSGVIAILAVTMLAVGLHTDQATARGRHFTQALHVAESGIEEALALIEEADGVYPSGTFTGTTELGAYEVTVVRQPRNRYEITSVGGVRAGRQLGAERSIRVVLEPPLSFDKALFSYTTVETKNNDIIEGDVWGNHNVILALGTQVHGSVIAASGYVDLGGGASVDEDAISGGFNSSLSEAVHLGANATVGGNVTASVVPVACVGADNADYKVRLDSGAVVGGNVKTWGNVQGAGTVSGTIANSVCTSALAAEELPAFTFNENNYDSVTYFGTPSTPSATAVNNFHTYVLSQAYRISGTFYINQASPVSQATQVDLTGMTITGDTTIISNAPIFANGVTDDTTDAIFALIDSYDPPSASACDVNNDKSECTIHLKNSFDVSGTTAVVVYSPYGSVAIKNNQAQFGSVYADSIQIKNNQTLTFDERIMRIAGFGEVTMEITEWVEL